MKTHSSLNLSRWLNEKGFREESDMFWGSKRDKRNFLLQSKKWNDEFSDEWFCLHEYPAYDLLWDICIRYAKEIWGSNDWYEISEHRNEVMYQIHHGSIEEAEKYIMENSILNK